MPKAKKSTKKKVKTKSKSSKPVKKAKNTCEMC